MKCPRCLAILLPVGLIAYAVFLIAYLPAAAVWSVASDAVPARLYGVEGSIWSGRAATAMVAGARFDAVHWELAPPALLSRTVAFRVRANLAHGALDTRVGFALGRGLVAEAVKAGTTVDTLFEWTRFPELAILADGRVEVRLRHLRMNGAHLASAQGRIIWRKATLNLGGGIPLGDVVARLRPADGAGTRITLSNDGGLLRLAGDGKLTLEGRYHLTLRLQARDPDDPASQRAARALGLPDPTGTVVEVSGVVGGPLPAVAVR
ncbi:MAG: type II secretion system protein N [Nitrococcus sp.]|nr:type II secretion system protein N [Nitrococcus sp.]